MGRRGCGRRSAVSAGVLCPSMADPVDLDDPHLRVAREAGESLLRVASLIQDAFVAATASESLSPLAARLLRAAVEPRPQRELGAQLGVDAARISLLTSELVERGLLTRTRGAGDQRVRRPELTASGRGDRATHRAAPGCQVAAGRRRSTSASCARSCACSSASSGGHRPAGR